MQKKLRSVLLVDDDNITNYLHQMLLEELEITEHIDTASDGEAALRKLNETCLLDSTAARCPEIVFLDLNMPRMDGFDFLEEFNSMDLNQAPPVRVIVLTSSSNVQDMRKAQSYRIDGYVNKPLTHEKIKDILSDI